MSAAGCSGAGSYSDGNPVKPPHPGIVTTPKVRKSKSKPPDRAASESPDSTLTTAEAPSRGGDNGVKELDKTATAPAASSRGVEELQQQTNGKKPRLVWTPELHDNFVRAYTSLGGRDAVPKKILGLMNVNGLTRENVASHLQKYRDNLQGKVSLPKSFQGKGKSVRRRGNNNGGATTTMRRTAPSLQPNFPQIQPIAAAFPQAASPSPSANPPPPPQRSFAAANMFHPQIGRGQGQIVHALPASLHQPHPNFPMAQAPMSPLLYRRPQLQAAMVERQRRMFMEHQARAQHAARMKNKAAVVPGHNHHTFLMNYELGAQTLPLAPGAAAAAVSGVHGHHLEQSMQASRAVNMSGGFCSVPEASMRHEQMETRMGVAQLQIGAEAEAGGQAPGAEPAFAGSADPDGGQQEDACGVLRFWNTVCAPSMDHEFPPNKPT